MIPRNKFSACWGTGTPESETLWMVNWVAFSTQVYQHVRHTHTHTLFILLSTLANRMLASNLSLCNWINSTSTGITGMSYHVQPKNFTYYWLMKSLKELCVINISTSYGQGNWGNEQPGKLYTSAVGGNWDWGLSPNSGLDQRRLVLLPLKGQ